jgi:hypothetical protein
MRINLLGGTYIQKYPSVNTERTINWYPVPKTQNSNDRTPVSLFPYPGLTKFVSLPGNYNRGIASVRTNTVDYCFTVVDTTAYQIFPNGSYKVIGSMPAMGIGQTSPVFIIGNKSNQVGFFNYNAGYIYTIAPAGSPGTFTQITNNSLSTYPNYVEGMDYMDGQTFLVSNGGVGWCNVNDMTTWPGINFLSPTTSASAAKAVATLKNQIWIFTDQTVEIYYNNAGTFTRQPYTTALVGLVAKYSIAKFDQGIFFLGRASTGETGVYLAMSNYTCMMKSDFGVSWALNNTTGSLTDAYGFIQYSKDGHIFYHLTLPSLGRTFVYDVMTQFWSERQSISPVNSSDGTTITAGFRAKYITQFQQNTLATDIYSPHIYVIDPTNVTENGTTIIRTRISQTYDQELKNMSIYNLQIDTNTGQTQSSGITPQLMIEASKNSGLWYSTYRTAQLGFDSDGDRTYRALVTQLGTQRLWTLKITLSDPVDLVLIGAIANGTMASY